MKKLFLLVLVLFFSSNTLITQNSTPCDGDCSNIEWQQIESLPYELCPNCTTVIRYELREGYCNGEYIREIRLLRDNTVSGCGCRNLTDEEIYRALLRYMMQDALTLRFSDSPLTGQILLTLRISACTQISQIGTKQKLIRDCPDGIINCCVYLYNLFGTEQPNGSISYDIMAINPADDYSIVICDLYPQMQCKKSCNWNPTVTPIGVIIPTDVDNNINGISIYPVPANDYLNINTDFYFKKCMIINILGNKKVYNRNLSNVKEMSIDISELSSGIYLVILESDQVIFSAVFTKIK